MASISIGLIKFSEVVRGDMLDVSFSITHNLDLTGKTLYAEVRREMDRPIILSFNEQNGSLTKIVNSATSMTLRFYKSASDMGSLGINQYQISVIMGTSPNYQDKQTIIEGTFEVVTEITKKPLL